MANVKRTYAQKQIKQFKADINSYLTLVRQGYLSDIDDDELVPADRKEARAAISAAIAAAKAAIAAIPDRDAA